MNCCFPRAIRSTITLKNPQSSFSNHLNRPILSSLRISSPPPSPPSFSSISSTPISPKPKTPLFLRPPTSSATISDLQKWQNWAKNLAFSIGSKFADSDNGPDTNILCREIKWLLEDAAEDSSVLSQLGSAKNSSLVNLRVDLEELYCFWKERIEKRRPFQYIVGCEHWRDLVLSVEEGVLIPRPETELIVDMVEKLVLEDKVFGEGVWADLGTGSGAIAIGIGKVLGNKGRVIATDLSEVAVSVAGFNGKRYGLQDKIEIRQGSWFDPLQDIMGGLVGLVSNPPYIPSTQISGLQAEVGRHEPRIALDGGESGIDDLLLLCEGAVSALKLGGFFAFETNGGKQCGFIADFIKTKTENSFRDVKIVSDFAGIQRFVTGFRR